MRVPRGREISVLLQSGVLAVIVPVMVKLLPLPRVLSILQQGRKKRESSCKTQELARIAGAVVRRGPRFGVGECLIRSLVVYRLLHRRANDAVLFIGGRLCDGRLDCHCWI